MVQARELPCFDKDPREHCAIQTSRVGIAQGGVIAREKVLAVWQQIVRSMSEAEGRFPLDDALREQMGNVTVEGDLAETDNDPERPELADLGSEVRTAVANLLRSRLVAGRGATNNRGDPCVTQPQTILARSGVRLIRESGLVKDGVHEMTRTISGEGPSGAVGPMGSRSEAQDKHAGSRISEAGNGSGPINLVLIGAPTSLADALAVGPKACTALAGDDGLLDAEQRWRKGN